MGLQKQKTNASGNDGDYWRIDQLNCNYSRVDAVCTVLLYKDEAARNAGATPMDSFQVDLAAEFHEANAVGDDIMKNLSLKEAYKALKKMAVEEDAKTEDKNDDLAFYADAVDV